LAKAFVETARAKEHITFAVLQDQSLFAGYNVSKDSVVIFKNFDEKDDKEIHFNGEANVAELSEFVQLHSVPLVVHFNYDYAPVIFGGSVKNHLLMFTSTKANGFQQLKDTMTKLAKEYKGKLLFIFVDTDNEELKNISQFFGVTEDEMPGLRIVSLGQDMLKYKSPDNSFEEEKVKLFIEQFLAGELKPDLLSEDIPEDWDLKPVKTLVGKNFNSVVDNTETKTLVMFYAPWCGHCQSLVSIWEELGEHFKDSKDVVIAKMDSTKNEIENVKIRAFPTIKLYLKGVDEVKDYNSIRTLEALLNFIKSDGMDGGAVDPDDDSYDYYDGKGGHDEL
jgi:protein disulfide-isomerase A1